MDPLLKITVVPIAIEMKVQNARLEYNQSMAEMEISRDEGHLRIKSSPIKLKLDTFEARNSVSPSPMTSMREFAQKGVTAAYEATANLAKEGQLLLKGKIGEDVIGQIIESRMHKNTDIGLDFIPKAGPDISWSEPSFTIEYEMDKLNFDWKVNQGDFEFIPGNIEISVTQWPDVLIEYIGQPIYVPPSANPDYVPLDVKA